MAMPTPPCSHTDVLLIEFREMFMNLLSIFQCVQQITVFKMAGYSKRLLSLILSPGAGPLKFLLIFKAMKFCICFALYCL